MYFARRFSHPHPSIVDRSAWDRFSSREECEPHTEAFEEGYRARQAGRPPSVVPFSGEHTPAGHRAWRMGYAAADMDALYPTERTGGLAE